MSEVKKEEVKEKNEEGDSIYEFVKAIAVAAVIALVVRSFAFEPFNIPSGSMFPTLLVGDYLFVEKYSYGYGNYSFPIPLSMKHRMFESMPERGDVAVFRHPVKPGVDYIKRIIGLPGDTIQMKGGMLNINGKPVMRDFRNTEMQDGVMYKKYIETLPDGLQHNTYELSDEDYFDNTPAYKVPNGYYFVMGDNRDSSLDSRAQDQVGFVPSVNLIGRAWFIFFSKEQTADKCASEGSFAAAKTLGCEVASWPSAIRFHRFFKVINKIEDEKTAGK